MQVKLSILVEISCSQSVDDVEVELIMTGFEDNDWLLCS